MSLRDHLQAIYDEHGRLTPELVVEAARPDDHPLHGFVFDRDPDSAAEAWYRHRAHELIQRVKITYGQTGTEPKEIRAFHAVRSTADQGGFVYEPIEHIAATPLLRQMVLRDAEREWKSLKAKYGHLREFLDMVANDLPEAA